MKKKLLVTLTYYSPHLSGLTIAIANLAGLLVKNGYTVSILTTRYPRTVPKEEIIQGVRVKRMTYLIRLSKGFLYPFFCFQTIRELRKHDQVMIVLPQPEGFLTAFFATLLRKRVLTYYICRVVLDASIQSRIITSLLNVLHAICLRLSDTIFVLSDDYARADPLLQTYKDKIVPLYPVIKKIVVSQKENEQLQRIPRRKYVIGFLGRIAREKGIHYLIQSIPLLQKQLGEDFVIVIAGPEDAVGEKAYSDIISSLIDANKKYVVSLGALPENSLGIFYKALDVLVFPSSNATDAFGMVQIEAMRMGTPVVAANLPGIRVCVQETKMGELFEPQDIASLARAILTVLSRKSDYKKRVGIAQKAFSDERIFKRFDTIFVDSEKS